MVVAEMRTAPGVSATHNHPSELVDNNMAIPKVSETPLDPFHNNNNNHEEEDSATTYGPFSTISCDPDESTTIIKLPNRKGHSVHFEKAQPDPIEQAFDKMFLLYDDVREATDTLREDGMQCGGGHNNNDNDTEATDFAQTLECVTEGLCRNPCVDTCSDMRLSPPVDLMLTVNNNNDDDDDEPRDAAVVPTEEPPVAKTESPATPVVVAPTTTAPPTPVPAAATRPVAKAVNFMLCKDNSVRDMTITESQEEESQEAAAAAAAAAAEQPTYTPVETVLSKMRTMVPEDMNMIQQLMDGFTKQYVGAKDDSDKLPSSTGSGDPIVDAIDNLIFAFEDMQMALEQQKAAMVDKIENGTCELPDIMPAFDMTAIFAALNAAKANASDETVASHEETVKTGNTFKIKPLSAQLSPEIYAEALHSVASLLSENAPEEDLKTYTKEELHQRALATIMAERDECYSESEYKTEEMILRELMVDAETAIMDARSNLSTEDDNNNMEPVPKTTATPPEALIVLGHSATLTPIPEADEGSTGGTPVAAATDKIEAGVKNGTCPEVPLAPSTVEEKPLAVETEQPALVEETTEESATVAEEQPAPAAEEPLPMQEWKSPFAEKERELPEEPLLVKMIDGMFLCYDDIKEQKPCTSCLGSSVPSDLTVEDPTDEIVVQAKSRDMIEGAKSMDSMPSPAPADELTEGQRMIQEALQLVQEASRMAEEKHSMTEDEARLGITRTVPQPITLEPTPSLMDQVAGLFGMKQSPEQEKAIVDLVDNAFESSDEKRLLRGQHTKLVVEIPESLKNGQQQDSYSAWGGDDSELMASINADRKYSEQEHVNIFRDVSKGENNQGEFSLYRTQAFTAGNSSSAELVDGTEHSQAALKALCEQSMSSEGK